MSTIDLQILLFKTGILHNNPRMMQNVVGQRRLA